MKTVFGLFKPDRVRPALTNLETSGFSTADLSIVTVPGNIPDYLTGEAESAAGEGMAVGAATGGLMGALGSLAASTIPGMQATLVSGLLGTAAGSAVGAYLGGLYTMRAETQNEIDLKDALDSGDTLILVHTTAVQAERAATLMTEGGGHHVETHDIPEDDPIG